MNDAYDVGLLILRLVLGLTLAAHGFNKFFGGGRIPGTAAWFESIGMKYGTFQAVVAATTEISAGLGLAAGLLTPIPAAGFVALMLVSLALLVYATGAEIGKQMLSTMTVFFSSRHLTPKAAQLQQTLAALEERLTMRRDPSTVRYPR